MDLNSLTALWIQHLKNNRIVSTQSDPKTGQLNYKKKPTVDDLIKFLTLKTDFKEEDIRAAINSVIQPSAPTTDKPEPEQKTEPGQEPQGGVTPPSQQALGNIKPAAKPRYKYVRPGQEPTRISEEIKDVASPELDEAAIKKIFEILVKSKAAPVDDSGDNPEEKAKLQRQEAFKKIKTIVRNTLQPAQIKALWRALSEFNLTEATINKADINAIFKDAAYLRSKPSVAGKLFKGLRKDKIDFEDLQKAWANGVEPDGSDGYSDDTEDIKRILKRFGFGDNEINKVFSQVFKTDGSDYNDDEDTPVASQEIQRLADIAKEKGVAKALKNFIEQEYGEELGIIKKKKASFKDIGNIFKSMIEEERTDRQNLIKEEERQKLGRTRK